MTHAVRCAAAAIMLLFGMEETALRAATPEPTTPTAAQSALGFQRMSPDQVVALLGIAVMAEGTEVGRIVDVLVDPDGHLSAAVIDVGGFLGVGTRKVAVEWSALHFMPGKTPTAVIAVAADAIKSAPAYDPASAIEAVAAPKPTAAEPQKAAPAEPQRAAPAAPQK